MTIFRTMNKSYQNLFRAVNKLHRESFKSLNIHNKTFSEDSVFFSPLPLLTHNRIKKDANQGNSSTGIFFLLFIDY